MYNRLEKTVWLNTCHHDHDRVTLTFITMTAPDTELLYTCLQDCTYDRVTQHLTDDQDSSSDSVAQHLPHEQDSSSDSTFANKTVTAAVPEELNTCPHDSHGSSDRVTRLLPK